MFTPRFWATATAAICGATYIFGFVLLFTYLAPSGYGMDGSDPAVIVGFLVENPGLMSLWNLSIYVVNGLALAGLAVVSAARFAPKAPVLSQAIQTFGLLWATLVVGAGMVANVGNAVVLSHYDADPEKAVLMWQIFSAIENGLGGGNEIAGSVWGILYAVAVFKTKAFGRALGWFSVVIGVAGLSTIIPALGDAGGAIFGLGYIAWFFWVAIAWARSTQPAQA